MDFTKIFQLKGLKPKNKGHKNFYECCDLTKKVCLMFIYVDSCHIHIWSRFICVVTFVPYIQCIYEAVSKYATHPSLFYSSEVLLWSFEQDVISDSSVQHQCFIRINKNLHRCKSHFFSSSCWVVLNRSDKLFQKRHS